MKQIYIHFTCEALHTFSVISISALVIYVGTTSSKDQSLYTSFFYIFLTHLKQTLVQTFKLMRTQVSAVPWENACAGAVEDQQSRDVIDTPLDTLGKLVTSDNNRSFWLEYRTEPATQIWFDLLF